MSRGMTSERLAQLDPTDANYAVRAVEIILDAGLAAGATDLHLRPTLAGLEWRWRVDGVLHDVATLPRAVAPNVIARLKVLAGLLTYHTDTPQEGRIRWRDATVEMRLSTLPTLHGEKGVVRLFPAGGQFQYLDELQFPADVTARLGELLAETSGALLLTGPAGAGKTTTAYAALREIARRAPQRAIASLEDPIEVELAGVAQSQVNEAAGFDLATGLKYLLRQDPEVILVSEVRDHGTAETVFQAALTGHLVISTFHAASAAAAISRLSDMGIEPYLLRSGIQGVLHLRLLRRLCECAGESVDAADRLGFEVSSVRVARGCERCHGSGYRGRLPIVELLTVEADDVSRAVLDRQEARVLEARAVAAGMTSRWERARQAIAAGWTSAAEARRVFGFSR